MSYLIKGNQKHLTQSNRVTIELELGKGSSFRKIASMLGKDPSTISNEIKKRRAPRKTKNRNHCIKRRGCTRRHMCSKGKYCTFVCRTDCMEPGGCNANCSEFISDACIKLTKAPFVCNGCNDRYSCMCDKFYYEASSAQNMYELTLRTSRQGVDLTKAQHLTIDSLVSPAVLNGQPIAHIYATHKSELNCSIRTIYNYLSNGYLKAKKLDTHRMVRYKPRAKNKQPKKDPNWIIGHSYEDYLSTVENDVAPPIVEMDTVCGLQGEDKVLLTLFIRNAHFMIIRLLNFKNQNEVVAQLNHLEKILGFNLFRSIFQIILTDRGTEFMNPNLIELSPYGLYRSQVYYCNPNAAWQKGRVEKNHEYIRYVLPKGTSFKNLTQEKVDILTSNINSVIRPNLDCSPFDLITPFIDELTLSNLGIFRIDPKNVILNPKLLR